MLLLPPIWLFFFTLFFAHGSLVYAVLFKFGGRPFRVAPRVFQTFWLGFGAVVGWLATLSLFFPIDGRVLAFLTLIACAGVPTAYHVLRRAWRVAFRRDGFTIAARVLTLIFLTLIVAYNATLGVGWYDTMSTHLQQVRWIRTYGAVTGLAALNPKLAFDQAHHLVAALMDVWIYRDRAVHVAVPFILMVTLAQWVVTLTTSATSGAEERGKLFAAFTVPFIASKAMAATHELASLSGDLAIALLLLAGMFELIRLPLTGARSDRRSSFGLVVALTLGALVFATKFSGAMFTIATFGLAIWGVAGGWFPRRRAALAGLVCVPTVIMIGAIARRLVLSGWPFFPVPILPVHLPWTLPREATVEAYRWIQSWARIPRVNADIVLGNGFFGWFVTWYGTFKGSGEFTLLMFGGTALIAWMTSQHLRRLIGKTPAALIPPTTAVLCLVYWAAGAPDLRFGGVFFWILLGTALGPIVAATSFPRGSLNLVVLLFSMRMTSWAGGFDFHLDAKPNWTTLDVAPVFETRVVTISEPNGTSFEARMPKEGDFCGNAELPCTPYLKDQRMRRPGDLSKGFRP